MLWLPLTRHFAHHSVTPYSRMRPPRAVTVRLAPVAGQIAQPASLLMLQTVQFPLPAATLLTAHSSMTPASTLPILWVVTQKSKLTAQSPHRLKPSLAAVTATSVTRWKRSIPRWMTLCCGMQQPMKAMVHKAPHKETRQQTEKKIQKLTMQSQPQAPKPVNRKF